MRFIEKGESPDFFEQEKRDFPLTPNSSWSEFQNPCKRKFKEYLCYEQDNLCAYCECDLTLSSSHIEHVMPRKYDANLKFAYENLVVSCDGVFECSEGVSCGHRKDEDEHEYNENTFLNPVIEVNINRYFSFDSETGGVDAAMHSREAAASEAIKILNLDALYLRNARLHAKELLVEELSQIEDDALAISILENELAQPREFISFLKSCFTVESE